MNQSPLLLKNTESNTKEGLADNRTLFNITNELAQTALQNTKKLVNDLKTPISGVKQVNQVMNELQTYMSQNLLPILTSHQKTIKQISQVIQNLNLTLAMQNSWKKISRLI